MAIPQADVLFPGIKQVESFEYSREHGITPGTACITIAPQEFLPAKTGPLVMAYGRFRLVMQDFITDTLSFQFNQQGLLWRLKLIDGRWKWRYGEVSGHYNERLPHGPVEKLNPRTEATPEFLVKELFKAMGVKKYNIASLPNLRPFVHWDKANPAQELADLCDKFGMRIVYRLNGSVAICPVGRGGMSGDREPLLPDGPIIQDSGTFDPPEQPDEIHFVCGPTRFEVDIPLEAVGDDIDGLVKPIDELSYAPKVKDAAGNPGKKADWSQADVVFFLDVPLVTGTIHNWYNYVSPRELAKQSVYRKYRVRAYYNLASGKKPLKIEGCKTKIENVRQILPIGLQISEPTYDPETGWFKPVSSILWGIYTKGDANNYEWDRDGKIDIKPPILYQPRDPGTGQLLVSKDTTVIGPESWNMDPETGIITLSSQVKRITNPTNTANRRYLPAVLWLRTSVTVSDWNTLIPIRHVVKRTMPPPKLGTGPHIVRDDDIFLRVTPQYSAGNPESSKDAPKDNMDIVKKYANERLDAEQKKFQTKGPRHVTYAGWISVDLDGGIVQVSWTMGKTGAFTAASLNDEIAVLTVPYQERRFIEKLRNDKLDQMLDEFNRNVGEKGYAFSRLSNVSGGAR